MSSLEDMPCFAAMAFRMARRPLAVLPSAAISWMICTFWFSMSSSSAVGASERTLLPLAHPALGVNETVISDREIGA